MPRFLHVGCGRKRKADTVGAFASSNWDEISLDIDEGVRPDIVDSLPELRAVEADSFDAVYSAHNASISIRMRSRRRSAPSTESLRRTVLQS